MRSVWIGAAASSSNTATNYHFPVAVINGSWLTTENQRSIPLSDDITIKRLRVWVSAAPTSGKSYAFTIRDDAVDTAATVTISDTNTFAEWNGSVGIAQLSLVSVKSLPTGTPTAPTNVYWIIDYETSGNFYLIPSGTGNSQSQDADLMMSPFGGNLYTPQGVTTARDEAVIPTGLSVTKIACYSNGTQGNTYWVRKNNTTDSSFSVTNGAGGIPAVSTTGSFAFAAGDTMLIRQNDSGASWTRHMICLTVVPDNADELVLAFTSPAAPSTTATAYSGVLGYASNTWDATESNVSMHLPGGTIKKLYVKLTTAPGSGKNRAFTLRSNAADTGLLCTVADANTTASDTSNSVTHIDGNFVSVKTVPTGTPAATSGAKFSFVFVLPQTHDFFAMF